MHPPDNNLHSFLIILSSKSQFRKMKGSGNSCCTTSHKGPQTHINVLTVDYVGQFFFLFRIDIMPCWIVEATDFDFFLLPCKSHIQSLPFVFLSVKSNPKSMLDLCHFSLAMLLTKIPPSIAQADVSLDGYILSFLRQLWKINLNGKNKPFKKLKHATCMCNVYVCIWSKENFL